jgi:hypothetical protein
MPYVAVYGLFTMTDAIPEVDIIDGNCPLRHKRYSSAFTTKRSLCCSTADEHSTVFAHQLKWRQRASSQAWGKDLRGGEAHTKVGKVFLRQAQLPSSWRCFLIRFDGVAGTIPTFTLAIILHVITIFAYYSLK